MKTIAINEANALNAYNAADKNQKTFLENLLGKETFSQNITDRVKTWEDAAEIYGVDPVESLPFTNPQNGIEEAANAFYQTEIIIHVLNEGWEPNWDNSNEYKWYPYFDMRTSGSAGGFSFAVCYYVLTSSYVGARLVLKTEALAKYAGTQFLHIYKVWMTK